MSFAKKIISRFFNVFGSIEQYLFLFAKQTLSKAHEICAKRDYDPEELFAHSNHASDPGEEGERLNVQQGASFLHLFVKVYK